MVLSHCNGEEALLFSRLEVQQEAQGRCRRQGFNCNPNLQQPNRLYLICLSVCVSVYDYSRTTGNEVASEQYQQLQCSKCSKKYTSDFSRTKAFEIDKLGTVEDNVV